MNQFVYRQLYSDKHIENQSTIPNNPLDTIFKPRTEKIKIKTKKQNPNSKISSYSQSRAKVSK